MNRSKIVVLDFGSQYAHLITKRFRAMGYYSEIALPSADLSVFEGAKGVVFSGGPSSVYEDKVPEFNEKILELDLPILGLCYGHHLMSLCNQCLRHLLCRKLTAAHHVRIIQFGKYQYLHIIPYGLSLSC